MTRRGALAEHPSHSPKENVFPRQDTKTEEDWSWPAGTRPSIWPSSRWS